MDFDFGDWENASWGKKSFKSSIGECIEKEPVEDRRKRHSRQQEYSMSKGPKVIRSQTKC